MAWTDTTYRIYDYDRRDQNGQLRDLHLEQSKDVIELGNQL
jgi:mannose-6-phosphate isomerase